MTKDFRVFLSKGAKWRQPSRKSRTNGVVAIMDVPNDMIHLVILNKQRALFPKGAPDNEQQPIEGEKNLTDKTELPSNNISKDELTTGTTEPASHDRSHTDKADSTSHALADGTAAKKSPVEAKSSGARNLSKDDQTTESDKTLQLEAKKRRIDDN